MDRDRTRDQGGRGDDVVVDENLIVDESIARGEGRVYLADSTTVTDTTTGTVAEGVIVEEVHTTGSGEMVGTAVTDVNEPDVMTEEVIVREDDLSGMGTTATADPTGRDMEPAFTGGAALAQEERLIEQVHDGMQVVDSSGDDLGKVTYMKMGDPDAVTTGGEYEPMDGGLLGDTEGLFGIEDEPKTEGSEREQMIRTGFIKIGGGLFRKAHYATAAQIASVSGDTVTLNVMKDGLAQES